jgi:hypothetical protein
MCGNKKFGMNSLTLTMNWLGNGLFLQSIEEYQARFVNHHQSNSLWFRSPCPPAIPIEKQTRTGELIPVEGLVPFAPNSLRGALVPVEG